MNFARNIQDWKVKNSIRFDFSFFGQRGFLTWHKRPVGLESWPKLPKAQQHHNVAIVVQGPYVAKRSFTLESLRLYRHVYPDAPLILSTWRNSVIENHLSALRELGVIVIESEPMETAYYGNLNRQQMTSLRGLEKAFEFGCEFALKTRTDQRLYGRDFLGLLHVLSDAVPLNRSKLTGITSRIFVTYQNSFINRPLSASDFMQFGHTCDLLRMWKSIDARRVSPTFTPEQVLLGSLALELGWPQEKLFTEQTWRAIRGRLLGFVDASSVDLFWFKYSAREYLWRRYGSETLAEVDQLDWLEAMNQQ